MARVWLSLVFCLSLPAFAMLDDRAALAELEKTLGTGHPDEVHRTVQRLGNKTIRVTTLFSVYTDGGFARKLLSDFGGYRDWALHQINQRSDGSTFLLQFQDIRVMPPSLGLLDVRYGFDLPLLRGERSQMLEIKSQFQDRVLTLTATTPAWQRSAIAQIDAYLKVFDRGDRSWCYGDAEIKLHSALVYQAFPDRVLMREAGERIQKVIDAFVRERQRRKSP